MEKSQTSKITKIYESYGYETKTISDSITVYTYNKGRYFGADIAIFYESIQIITESNLIQDRYRSLGYATSLKRISSIEETEYDLFNSFFLKEQSINRLKKKYKDFISNISKINFGEYKYIHAKVENEERSQEVCNIFELIYDKFTSTEPELIILEALAGYGKTCTAFEILTEIIDRNQNQIPILTELSRNRGIKKFRYILLDEIDNEFPHLNSEIVIREIQAGRIPLIIDGFDELIENSSTPDRPNKFEDAETMLDTIGSLLSGKSKIILTSRKTALFSGNEFNIWSNKFSNRFNVTRLTIKEPKVKDWIGIEKYNKIKDTNIPFNNIANPVLLTFLRNIEMDIFQYFLEQPAIFVDWYFDLMLEREKERQGLLMTAQEQFSIFTNVTNLLIEFDSSSEEKSFFKEIILDTNRKQLEKTRRLYTGEQDKHNIETLVDTLSNHALLNTKGREKNRIGFINDFIFGTLIGRNLIDDKNHKIKNISLYMIELAVTAFKVQTDDNKELLWNRISEYYEHLPLLSQFFIDVSLLSRTTKDYVNLEINDYTLHSIDLSCNKIDSIVFVNCTFKNSIFNLDLISQTSFISCKFIKTNDINNAILFNNDNIIIIDCVFKESSLRISDYDVENTKLELNNFDLEILKFIWDESVNKYLSVNKLLNNFKEIQTRNFTQSFNNLIDRNYIKLVNGNIDININKIDEIKKLILR